MKIQVLGVGCPLCKKTKANVIEALQSLGIAADVEEVTDPNRIIDFGVIGTPALVVDGDVKFYGKVPTVEEIKKVLE
ncbi:MAG: thioredoxin family protein [Actinobacteria bacterium]|nr:thioredoxin family protein [Actinomycetota bacterium]